MNTPDSADDAITVVPLPVDLRAAFANFQATGNTIHAEPETPIVQAEPMSTGLANLVLPKVTDLPRRDVGPDPFAPAQERPAMPLEEAAASNPPRPARKTRAVPAPAPSLDDDDDMESSMGEMYEPRPTAGLTDVDGAKRIVSTAYNPSLVFEVAMQTAPLIDILKSYNMSWTEYERIASTEEFSKRVMAIRAQAERDPNMLVSMKARTLFEAMMPEMFAAAMEKGANPAFKYKTFDLLATIARVKPTTAENNGNVVGGNQFVFNLTIDAGYKDVTPVNEIQGYTS